MEETSKRKVHKFDMQKSFGVLPSLNNEGLGVLMPLRWAVLQTS